MINFYGVKKNIMFEDTTVCAGNNEWVYCSIKLCITVSQERKDSSNNAQAVSSYLKYKTYKSNLENKPERSQHCTAVLIDSKLNRKNLFKR